jgi:selenocysteine lyase/cysteine desulfurase
LLDAAQSVSHLQVDVQALDCDWCVFSGHKIFGPTGIGAVYGKAELLEAMPPWQGGGNMIEDVTFEKTIYQPAPAVNGDQKPPIHGCKTQLPLPRILFSSSSNIAFL